MNIRFSFLLLPALLLAPADPVEAQRSEPTVHGGGYKIAAGPVEITVAPSRGARVRSLKFEGTELLYQADSTGNPGSMGSVFWISPQAHWTANCRNANNNGCWPPPTAHDGSGNASLYTGGLLGDSSVSYTGSAESYTGARIRKTFWGNPADSSISIRYHMVNTSASAKAYAGWEVTRMTTGGLTFWAKSDEHVIAGNGTSGQALINMIKDTLGVKWHKYDSTVSLAGGTPKFWDGTSEGWFARVDKSRLLYIKAFEPIPPSKRAHATENQIEYYTNNNTRTITEMELQGPYDSVAAGDSLQWEVKWYVRRLPDSIPVTMNSELLALTRATVAGQVSPIHGRAGGALASRLSVTGNRVALTLRETSSVSLILMDARGATVQKLHSGALERGSHAFRVTPSAKGLYWLVLRDAGNRVLEVRALPRL